VLTALNLLFEHVVKQPDLTTGVHPRIAQDPRFSPYFDNCIGALDGTHINAHPGLEAQAPFRNRHGYLSHNVLAACTFDLQFSFVYPGWEGSANDQRVLQDAIARGGFRIPNGRFYLGDAGYVNTGTILTPFRRTRYHLREVIAAGEVPETYQELFNMRHSTLRNEVERIFGVLKRRFPFLKTDMEYDLLTQTRVIFAVCALHNYIRQRGVTEDDIFEDGLDEINEPEEANEEETPLITRQGMNTFRDQIAQDMFEQWHAYRGA